MTGFPLPEDQAIEVWPACFYCGNSIWKPGPRGGASTNVICCNCGQKLNLTFRPAHNLDGEMLWGHVIEPVEELRQNYLIEKRRR